MNICVMADLTLFSAAPCHTTLIPTLEREASKALRRNHERTGVSGTSDGWRVPQSWLCAVNQALAIKLWSGDLMEGLLLVFLTRFFLSTWPHQTTWMALENLSTETHSTLWVYRVLTDWYKALLIPLPPYWSNFFLANRRERKLLNERLHIKYIGESTGYLLHGTKQKNKNKVYHWPSSN